MSQSTYYTCNGCDHATFRLSEAIAHFAFFGGRHSFDSLTGSIIDRNEWEPLVCQTWTHTSHLEGGCGD